MIIRARLIAEPAELYRVALFITIREHGEGVYMSKRIDLKGKVFGRITVIEEEGSDSRGEMMWRCKCECGKEKITTSSRLRTSQTKSCGCLQKETVSSTMYRHGMSNHPNYVVWASMRKRCNNKNNLSYPDYGGRGIEVCKRWDSFSNFLADVGERPTEKHTLERKNNDGNYEPTNCCWSSRADQARNTRTTNKGDNGISLKKNGKWGARISVNNKRINIGTFINKEDALKARKQAEEKYWKSS